MASRLSGSDWTSQGSRFLFINKGPSAEDTAPPQRGPLVTLEASVVRAPPLPDHGIRPVLMVATAWEWGFCAPALLSVFAVPPLSCAHPSYLLSCATDGGGGG